MSRQRRSKWRCPTGGHRGNREEAKARQMPSCVAQNFFHDATGLRVGDAFFLAVMVVNEFGMIDAEEVEQGSVVIVWAYRIDDSFVSKFVGLAVSDAAFNAAARQPGAEALAVMIAAGFFGGAVIFGHWQAANFAAPMNDCRIEQPARFEVF